MPAISAAETTAEVDEVARHEAIPVEAVVGTLPQGRRGVEVGLALERVGNVERVGEEERAGLDERLEETEVVVFVGVVQRLFAQGEELGSDDSVNHVAFDPTHRLGLCDDNDVLVFTCQHSLWCRQGCSAYPVAA